MLPQGFNIGIGDGGRGAGQFFGVGAESQVRGRKGSLRPISGDEMDKIIRFGFIGQTKIVGDLSTEVVGVGTGSVEAMVNGRNNGGEHFPLGAA